MSDFPILLPGRGLPRLALVGAVEDLVPIGEFESARTLHGRLKVLKPAWSRMWGVRLSNSGDGVADPCLDDLREGDDVTVWSSRRWSLSLGPGQTTRTLLRVPVPGSVHARDAATDAEIEVAVAGRTVTIFGRAGHTVVSYRPVLDCALVRVSTGGGVTTRLTDWSLDLEERGPPA